MSLRLPEPGTFEDLLRPVRVEVASLVRLSRYPGTEPYWSSGVYRFDDPDPGRAGDGHELGGTRGMQLYMQRCAVMGYKPTIEGLLPTGRANK